MTVFFTPHHDDETLFGAFTLIREQPQVVVCFESEGDYGSTAVRFAELTAALAALGVTTPPIQWAATGIGHLEALMRDFDQRHAPTRVWAPDWRASHRQHAGTYLAAHGVFGDRLCTYHTYMDGEKVREGAPVVFEPEWLLRKLHAMACYRSQVTHPRAYAFFGDDLLEYIGAPA